MSKAEIQYFLTFAAGIAAFWLSGQAVIHLVDPHLGRLLVSILSHVITFAVYGLIMAVLAWLIYGARRTVKAVLAAVVAAVILDALGAQLLLHVVAPMIHTTQQINYFNFAAYLLYGVIYVVSAALGRRMLH